jgi:hypothetical protein
LPGSSPSRRQIPAGRRPRATPPTPRCDDRSRQTRLRREPAPRSGPLAQAAPRFALTLRAMRRLRLNPTGGATRSPHLGVVSLLALLALVLGPSLAQADSSGVQYSDAPPTATGDNVSGGSSSPARSSEAPGKGSTGGGSSTSMQGDSSAAGSQAGDTPATGGAAGSDGGGNKAQGSQGGPSGGEPTPAPQAGTQPLGTVSPTDDGGSSLLLPILIGAAILAAISGALVMVRSKRPRGPGSSSASTEAS